MLTPQIYVKNKARLGSGNPLFQVLPKLAWYVQQPSNSLKEARQNISSHYDTSNALFSAFLSPDMNYACAHWANAKEEDTLETAQKRKINHLLRKAQLDSSHHLLDIGCGWGDLAITAAQTTGCRVTGVTLAEEQKQLAEKRVKAAGLDKNGQVRILLCDYRSTPAPGEGKQYYDRIISIGMFEHVGPQFLDGYFEVISKLLHPVDGRMVIDGISKMNKVPLPPSFIHIRKTNVLRNSSTRIKATSRRSSTATSSPADTSRTSTRCWKHCTAALAAHWK